MAFTSTELYPTPSRALLHQHFVGKKLQDVETPAAVIDRAVAEEHCSAMLETVDDLGLQFRAHVKTHKVR